MTDLQIKALCVLICLFSIHTFLLFVLSRFRRNLVKDQVVGVKFGDYVVNRKINLVFKHEVSVLDFEGKVLVNVPFERIYMKSAEGDSNG